MNLAFGVLQNTRPAEIKKFFLFISFTYFPCQEVSKSKGVVPREGGGGGGDSHTKRAGMLVVSLKGCKLRSLVSLRVFWAKHHYI